MISVIIPNYNHAFFLKRRIDSILNQTYQDFELIILDDCSSDSSKELIEQFRTHPKTVHIVYNESNSGSPFKQWELGISLAKGKYIWIAESDDWAENNFLEEIVSVLEINSKVGLAYCNSNVYKNDELWTKFSELNNSFMNMNKWSNNYNIPGREELVNLSLVCTINNVSAVVFRRPAIESAFPLKHYFKCMGDWLIYLKIAKSYDIAYIANPLNNCRYHSDNASKQVDIDLTYVRERFYISNYLIKECRFLDKDKLLKNLYDYCFHKLEFNTKSLNLYVELFKVNHVLLFKLLKYILFISLKAKLTELMKYRRTE